MQSKDDKIRHAQSMSNDPVHNNSPQESEFKPSTSILDLPKHIFKKILELITRDRICLSLVCKKFYEIVCEIYEDKLTYQLQSHEIIISDDRLEKLKALTIPMDNCQLRRLRNMKLAYIQKISEDSNDELWHLLDVQGIFLRKLTIEAQIKIEVLFKILSKTENLTELILSKIEILPEDYEVLDMQHLKHLKNLTVDACEKIDFTKLKICENSLTNFKFNSSYCAENFSETLKIFLSAQNNLKEVVLSKSFSGNKKLKQNFLENCKLERLEWSSFYEDDEDSRIFVEEMIQNQVNLKFLKFPIKMWSSFFDKITKNLKNLEEFSGNFEEIDNETFWKISNLQKLKKLEILNGNLDQYFTENDFDSENCCKKLKIENITEFKNLNSLSLKGCKFSSQETAKNLSNLLPNLKILNCECFSQANLQFDFHEILTNFAQVENLNFNEFCDLFRDDAYKLENEKISKNENLKILRVHFPLNMSCSNFENLTDKFPNLVDLKIYIHKIGQKNFKDEIEIIFKKFDKLEKIFITFAFTCEIDFDIFDLIKSKPTLKFVYIANVGFNDEKFKQNVEILKDQFEEIGIIAEGEYGMQNCYAISLAKNYSIYKSKLEEIMEYIEVSTHDDLKFFL